MKYLKTYETWTQNVLALDYPYRGGDREDVYSTEQTGRPNSDLPKEEITDDKTGKDVLKKDLIKSKKIKKKKLKEETKQAKQNIVNKHTTGDTTRFIKPKKVGKAFI